MSTTTTGKLTDIYIVDTTVRDTATILAQLGLLITFRRGVGIRSIEDMVSRVIKVASGRGAKIRRLRIIGHGNAHGQRIGKDFLSVHSLPKHAGALKRLIPYFAADAEVTLGGCQVGQGVELLQQLSQVLGGVTVRAMTALQRPGVPGDEGGVQVCQLTMCSYSGDGFWNRFDARQAEKKR